MKREKNTHAATKTKHRWNNGYVPFALLIITCVTYLPLVRKIGFYWDDWAMLWFDVTQGPAGFAAVFTSDRPFLGFLYQITGALIGKSPLHWQLLTVLFRWLVSWAFWWTLQLLWNDRKNEVFWIAVLLTVYSGFKQMPIAYVWGNALILLFFYIWSYGAMLKGIFAFEECRFVHAILWTVFGVAAYTICTVCTEYYTGLDLVRGVMILIFICRLLPKERRTWLNVLKKTILFWIPFLLPFGIFMFWRIFIFKFPSYQPVLVAQFQANPWDALLSVFSRSVEDAYTATWGAWTEFIQFPFLRTFDSLTDQLFWVVASIGFFLCVVFALAYWKRNGDSVQKSYGNWTLESLGLGLSAVFLPGLPYLVTSLSPALDFPRERWLSAYMFGSAIFMVALIAAVIRGKKLQILFVAFFAAAAMGGNIRNANSFRRDWLNQQSFIAQLQERIPALDGKTYFMSDSNALVYETDNSLTGMVNLALDSQNHSLDLPLAVGFYDIRIKPYPETLEEKTGVYQGFRSAVFSGGKEDIVAYFYSPPGCLRIVDPKQHSTFPIFPPSFKEFIAFSHPENILPTGQRDDYLQREIFEQVMPESWCTHFERADLARQYEDWDRIVAIGDEALSRFQAAEATEYVPFIEAYAHAGRWTDAARLIAKVHEMNRAMDGPLCPIVQKLFVDFFPKDAESIDSAAVAITGIGCNAYSQ